MCSTSYVIPYFLALCTIAAGLIFEESFVPLYPRASPHPRDPGFGRYLSAREATPSRYTNLDPWDDDYTLLRRHARPWPQVNIDGDFEIPRLYVRSPTRAKSFKQGAVHRGNSGNSGKQKKPSGGSPQGGSPRSSKSTPTAAKDSTSDDGKSKDQTPPVKQNYNWPPPGYGNMNTAEKRMAAAKARQQGHKSESTTASPATGSFVRPTINRLGQPTTSPAATTNKALSQNYADAVANTDKPELKKDMENIFPVSHRPHSPRSGASSWASVSRSSSVGAGTMSRQNSGKSTLSGVHVEKPSSSRQQQSDIKDGWTEV